MRGAHRTSGEQKPTQRRFLRDVSAFIGETRAVSYFRGRAHGLHRPANSESELAQRCSAFTEMQEALKCAGLGPHEMLVGIDGVYAVNQRLSEAVVHLTGLPLASSANTTLKIYPPGNSNYRTLIRWRLTGELANFHGTCEYPEGPSELAAAGSGVQRCRHSCARSTVGDLEDEIRLASSAIISWMRPRAIHVLPTF